MASDTRKFTVDERWHEVELVQEAYPNFKPFLYDVITELMGFECTEIQLDIADFLEYGPKERMIQAQRGQAKTTITAAYAVWRLIHNPSARILIVSAGGTMASEISGWIIQIIKGMEILECMRPDRSAGDRESVEKYDIHYALKGPEKSPSIKCLGISSNMQGTRADIVIADDIESSKNAATEAQRDIVLNKTRDFTSICSNGDIIYLGTPQSVDSIYNGLYARGYSIRVWTGRYPTVSEESNYGTFLAPLIKKRMELDPDLRTGGGPTGERGKAVDPVLLGEATLTKKEIDQGPAYFQLQHMLDTRLADADRYPLKSEKLVFMHISDRTAPLEIYQQRCNSTMINTPADFPTSAAYYRAFEFGKEMAPFTGCHMYVDPAGGGQNGDETAYAITRFLGGRVFVVDVGSVPGGLDEGSLNALTAVAVKWKPTKIDIEKNFGNGALAHVWRPLLARQHRAEIEDVWESGQKELRIIDVLEPVIGSGRLVIEEDLLRADWERCKHYPLDKRASYSLFYQIARLTRDKNSLRHDDRLDALAGSVRYWVEALAQDSMKIVNQQRQKVYAERMRNPLGDGTPVPRHTLSKLGLGYGQTAVSRVRRQF